MHRSHRVLFASLALVLALFVGACGDDDDDNPVNPAPTLELNSGNIAPAGTYEHRFFTDGTYPYRCTLHTGMNGSVVVSSAATDTTAAVGMTAGNQFTPATVTIKTGGKVTWTNSSGVNHNVTSTN